MDDNSSRDDEPAVYRLAPGQAFNLSRGRPEPVNPPVPTASGTRIETFLESLPFLSLTDLPANDQDCPVCVEAYSQLSESPVLLPCNHIIGKDCLTKWVNSSVRNANNNSCPTCRAVLFNRYGPPVFDLVLVDELLGLELPTSQSLEDRLELERLRTAVDIYSETRNHARSMEELYRVRRALTQLCERLDGIILEDAHGLLRRLDQAGPPRRMNRAERARDAILTDREHTTPSERGNQRSARRRQIEEEGRARERTLIEEAASLMWTDQERELRHTPRRLDLRPDRSGGPTAIDQRRVPLTAEMANQPSAAAEHIERLNRPHAARRPPVAGPQARDNHSGRFTDALGVSEEWRRLAAERLSNRRNNALRFTMERREAGMNRLGSSIHLNGVPARVEESQAVPEEQERVATAQPPNRRNAEQRFTIPRPEITTHARPQSRHTSINERITRLNESLTRMENEQRVLAGDLERLASETDALRGAFTGGGGEAPADPLGGVAFVEARIAGLNEDLARTAEQQRALAGFMTGMAGDGESE